MITTMWCDSRASDDRSASTGAGGAQPVPAERGTADLVADEADLDGVREEEPALDCHRQGKMRMKPTCGHFQSNGGIP